MRLLVLTPGELTRDPRARRAALTAAARGHETVGLCPRSEDAPGLLDGVSVVRVRGERLSAALRRAGLGGMRRSHPLVREARGVYRLLRLSRRTFALAAAGRRLGPFDVVHANDFDTLPAAWLIARRGQGRVVYDSHELYTTQEPDPPRAFQLIAGAVEGALARRAAAVVTSGPPYAAELKRRLRLARDPAIVLNCPERITVEPPEPPAGALRVIYQAAMGPGRPLADVVAAAAYAEGVEITLRVVGADEATLLAEIDRHGLADRVRLAEPVSADRLVEGLWGFHCGLIINRPVTLTDELVLPNKLFEYMMAGLAVVVPRLPGLAPLVEVEAIGVCFEPGRPDDLGAALARLAADREGTAEMGRRARKLALERYNAQTQAEELARVWDRPERAA